MMFSATLRSALISTVLCAVFVAGAPGLTLSISGPQKVDGVDNLKVVTTLRNTGDESLKLLNDPSSPLSKMPTETFKITHSSGSTPDFTGIRVKYVPKAAAASGNAKAFTVLAPGQSVDVTHDLSNAYNFTRTGEGEYKFNVRNMFQHVDADNNIVPLIADTPSAHSASISGKLAVARPFQHKDDTCSTDQADQIDQAARAAKDYVTAAASYLVDLPASSDRYETWFGQYTDSRYNTVQGDFDSINTNDLPGFTYDCSCTEDLFAYVYPDQFGKIYLCNSFWNAPATGTDSKAGTIVHEASHFTLNGGTQDVIYGQAGCKDLAQSDPDNAVRNADSHEYFAENTPALS